MSSEIDTRLAEIKALLESLNAQARLMANREVCPPGRAECTMCGLSIAHECRSEV